MYFFYFTHTFLQNTHISLSILHIYSIKYFKANHHQPDQYPATINDQYLAFIINPHNHHHQASLHHQPTHQNLSHHQPGQYPWIKIIKTHSSKSSKPSHHQPDQYSATINDQYPTLHH